MFLRPADVSHLHTMCTYTPFMSIVELVPFLGISFLIVWF